MRLPGLVRKAFSVVTGVGHVEQDEPYILYFHMLLEQQHPCSHHKPDARHQKYADTSRSKACIYARMQQLMTPATKLAQCVADQGT